MKKLLILFFSIYIAIGFLLYIFQKNFIYFPPQKITTDYPTKKFPGGFEATVLNPGKERAIMYFGGNAENVDFNIPLFSRIFKNRTLYLVKYKGYAGAPGEPSEKENYKEALSIYDNIKKHHNAISVIGRSLGSGVATYLASKRKIDRLALITPFDSIESIAQENFPIYPISIILTEKYNSIGRAKKIKAKTLILAAENDQVVSEKHTKNLANGLEEADVIFKTIENTDHNSISASRKYENLLRLFFAKESI